MSKAGIPRMRSRSVHIPMHIPIAHKAGKLRTTSTQRTQTKGKGKGKKTIKKPNKAVAVVSSDSEDLEVEFLHYHPNQPHEVPVNLPQEHSPLADAPVEEQQELDHPVGAPIEKPYHPTHVPAEDIQPPQDPGNPNPIPVQPPTPMANNQLNWSHFRPEISGTPHEDTEAHLLRMED